MSFTFNKIYVQSRLVFAFSALAEMSVVRAQSSIGHYNISRGNSIVSVLEEAILTAQHAEEMPVPPITIHATPPSPGIQSGHPVAPVFPASLSIDIEITHYYTHLTSTSRVQGAAPTFTAFTTTVHSRSSTRSTVSMAESTSSALAPISDRVSIMVVTPMLPLFSPSPVNDCPTVNDYTITVQDSQPPSSSLVFASTFSRPLPRTTLVPSDGHAVDSGSARNGFKDAAPVVVIVVSILVTGILVYAYYALKRKWQRHRQATAAAAVRDDDLACINLTE
ncbi:SubName: Full=Uncharacterized protein {ECO:0000313/EMBL:CCA75657.1} [Serendipita indica DSM 11827]|nr:SubName: Full=Uncharacterized protein {ECO:0000313/EMBL:CCA75657.1} [Serendipita indica DSM 11827]